MYIISMYYWWHMQEIASMGKCTLFSLSSFFTDFKLLFTSWIHLWIYLYLDFNLILSLLSFPHFLIFTHFTFSAQNKIKIICCCWWMHVIAVTGKCALLCIISLPLFCTDFQVTFKLVLFINCIIYTFEIQIWNIPYLHCYIKSPWIKF